MSVALVGITVMQAAWIRNMIRLNAETFDENVFAALNATADRLAKLESLDAYVNGYSIGYVESRFGGSRSALTTLAAQRVVIGQADPARDHPEECSCAACSNDRWKRYLSYNQRALDASLESRIDRVRLDTILRQELHDRGIAAKFSYGVYSRERRDFILVDGHYVVGRRGPVSLVEDRAPHQGSLATSKYAVALYDDIALVAPGLLAVHFPQLSSIVMAPVWLTIIVSGLLLAIILACFAYSIFIIFRQKRLSLMKNDFISNMTHEFKTPIATISLAADSITNPRVSGDPAKLERFAGIIRQENRRMNRQVEKVLQAAQIDRRDFKLRPVSVDVNELLGEAATHMGLQVERRGGVLEAKLEATDPVIVADRTHVSNILHNLIDNAIKYSPEAPHITVRTEDTRGGVMVHISDRGIGMTREDQRQIFEQFFRVHTGNRHDVKGFGLGLSYVKAIVEAHGGRIDVESTLGEGSTFTVELPRAAKLAAEA